MKAFPYMTGRTRCFTESKAIYQMHDIGMVALVASHLKVVQKAS